MQKLGGASHAAVTMLQMLLLHCLTVAFALFPNLQVVAGR